MKEKDLPYGTEREKLVIRGGVPLNGVLTAQGAKNAALPIMAASLLLKGKRLTIDRVPDLHDIHTMADLLSHLGVKVEFRDHRMTLDVPDEIGWETPPSLVRKMRASSLVLGPLIARCGRAVLPLPGGCAIGSRPIDFHIRGLSKMGTNFELVQGASQTKTGGHLECHALGSGYYHYGAGSCLCKEIRYRLPMVFELEHGASYSPDLIPLRLGTLTTNYLPPPYYQSIIYYVLRTDACSHHLRPLALTGTGGPDKSKNAMERPVIDPLQCLSS